MYIFKIKKLAQELNSNSLNQNEIFKYFLTTIILSAAQVQIQSQSTGTNIGISNSSFIIIVIYFFVVFLGTIFLFKTNSKGDGKSFVERYICLSVPTMIILYLIWGVIFLITGIVNIIFPEKYLEWPIFIIPLVYSYFSYIFMILFYYLMYKNLKIASGQND